MNKVFCAAALALVVSGCCTGNYSTRSDSPPPDFIVRFPSRVAISGEVGSKVRIPISFVNSGERTLCLGKPESDGGWKCGFKPELQVRTPQGSPVSATVDTSGLLMERIKRGRDAVTDDHFYAELTLEAPMASRTSTDICLELLLRDAKGKASVISRAGGPVQVLTASNAVQAPAVDQSSEMTDKPIDCGFGTRGASQ